MQCERCSCAVEQDEIYEWYGKKLCEDCYMDALQPPKPCDPAAVSSAKATRAQLGHRGVDGLTPLQKQIYGLIKDKGRITREELTHHFELPSWELEKQFAVLRHCELVRGFKEGNTIYLAIMSPDGAKN